MACLPFLPALSWPAVLSLTARCPRPPAHLLPHLPPHADDQLRQLAAARPATQRQLAALIGAEKAELYGAALLAALLAGGEPAPPHGGAGGSGAGTSAGGNRQQQAQRQQQQQEGPTGGGQPRARPAATRPAAKQVQQAQQARPAQQAREVVVLDSSDEDDSFMPTAAPARKRGKQA